MKVIAEATGLVVLASVLGLAFDVVRPSSLGFFAAEPYEIYQDCPMLAKEALGVKIDEISEDDTLVFIDARSLEEYHKDHVPGARSIPYHPLRAPKPEMIAELRSLGPNQVLVYGDREIDSGQLLAAELASAGLLGVRFIEGGWELWQSAQHKQQLTD